MEADLNAKVTFLDWCLKNLHFRRREVYWLLNYLLHHPGILKNTHFVEDAHKNSRSLIVQENTENVPLYFLLDGHTFTDPEQIFHEIRFHWQKPLYVEVIFKNAWQNANYMGVLEDNPEASWNDEMDFDLTKKIEATFSKLEKEERKSYLLAEINRALENGEETTFLELSEELKKLSAEKV